MLRLIPKSHDEVQTVRDLYHSTKDVRIRTRAQIILLAFERLSAPKIAKIVDMSGEGVRHHVKRYRAEGIQGIYDKERSGRPRIATPEYVEAAVAALRRRPRALGLPFSVWTLDRLVDYLRGTTGITVSYETLRTHLLEQGFSFSRPQHTVSSPDPEYVQKKRRLTRHETT
jgi:transposase